MSTSFARDTDLPSQLAPLAGRQWEQITLGRSEASVWRIGEGDETLYLKREVTHLLGELPDEAQRLQWLATTSIPAPRLCDSFEADGFSWLLMTALPGSDLTHLVDRPADLCNALATGLHALHTLDPATCPFDHRLDARLQRGAANVVTGRVDESDFDEAHDGWSAQAVLAWLLENRPGHEDLVVTHGDASLPNIIARDGHFAGIIDCGRLGVADRWQDLALACRSIIYNCGQDHVAAFLAACGAEWDEQRYRYYCTLDELF